MARGWIVLLFVGAGSIPLGWLFLQMAELPSPREHFRVHPALAAPLDQPVSGGESTSQFGDDVVVRLSAPTLVARSKGYLWFPTLVPLRTGDVVAVMNNYPDAHTRQSTSWVAWSTTPYNNWSAPRRARYGDTHIQLSNGEALLLPFYLHPRRGGLGAPCQVISNRDINVADREVVVTGLPRKDRNLSPTTGLAGFVFNGQSVLGKNDGFLATLYGYFQGQRRYSLLLAESTTGFRWSIRSIIASDDCPLPGKEGPCEAALCRLKDGRLMCVFRMQAYKNYGQSFSSDEGKTWSMPTLMPFGSVQPSLTAMNDGTVVLTGGRPGLFAWFNRDGKGKSWQLVDLRRHHNRHYPGEAILWNDQTTAYTEVVAISSKTLLVIYDRIPHGWKRIPTHSLETNSVWVVKINVE